MTKTELYYYDQGCIEERRRICKDISELMSKQKKVRFTWRYRFSNWLEGIDYSITKIIVGEKS